MNLTFLKKLFPKKGQPRNEVSSIDASNFRREILKQCPICQSTSFKGHRLYWLGSVTFQDEMDEQGTLFMDLIQQREWQKISQIQLGKKMADWLEIRVLRCSRDEIVLLEILAPFELLIPDQLRAIITLTEVEQNLIKDLIRDKEEISIN